MKTLYEKIEIHSEADCPKEEGEYFCNRNGFETVQHLMTTLGISYMREIRWYLSPLPQQEPERTAIPIILNDNEIDELRALREIKECSFMSHEREDRLSELTKREFGFDMGYNNKHGNLFQTKDGKVIQGGLNVRQFTPQISVSDEQFESFVSKELFEHMDNNKAFDCVKNTAMVSLCNNFAKNLRSQITSRESNLPLTRVIVGYKCKLCGAVGKFEDFPHFTSKDEDGLKDTDTYCMNKECEGGNDDLEEIYDDELIESRESKDKEIIERYSEIVTLYSEYSSGLSDEMWHRIDNLKSDLAKLQSKL
jgi:hypothetical protein